MIEDLEVRKVNGEQIAKTKNIKPFGKGWIVPSQTKNNYYIVNELFRCNCPDFQRRGRFCKHVHAVQFYLMGIRKTNLAEPVKERKITYPQDWKSYNKAQIKEIKLFDEFLKDLIQIIEEPKYVFGRPPLSLKETLFCAIQKVYSQLSSRRAFSLYENAINKKQINKAPHFNAVSKLLNREDITLLLQKLIEITAKPLKSVETKFAIDSTGFRTRCFGQYAEEKFNMKRRHKWIKVHAISGVKTNIITSVKITNEYVSDSPQFKDLVKSTAKNFTINEVSADKGYSSRANHQLVAELGGTPFILFKKNAKGMSKGFRAWGKMYHYFQFNREEFLKHYHKRSNAESVFSAMKKKFGDTLKSKNHTAQTNEMLCKIIAYNITVLIQEMHELGIKPDFLHLK